MLIIFALIFGGGFGWNRGQNNCATTEDLANGFNFSASANRQNEILSEIRQEGRNTDNAVCRIGYQNLEQSNTIMRQIADCCCTTQRAIDSVKFDMANYSAAANAKQGQRIAALEADARMCGVVRYPTTATYASFCNPFFGFGNGCNNI